MTQPALRLAASPFSDLFLSHLYRAAPGEVGPLVADLPAQQRVQLALFCFARAHLRAIGREIATACDDADLRRYAPGVVGASLRDAKRASESDDDGSSIGLARRPRVTLATAADMRRKFPVAHLQDDVDADTDLDLGSDDAD